MGPRAIFLVLALGTAAHAERVNMVLLTEPGFPATSMQEWYQTLTALKVDNLQIRQAAGNDRVQVLVGGSEQEPVYSVTGVLTAQNDLMLPGGRYGLRDRAGLSAWLGRLRRDGPVGAEKPKLPFGLTAEQFTAAHDDLARAVEEATKGRRAKELLDALGGKLRSPLVADAEALRLLDGEDGTVLDELRGVSAGTALAAAMRPAGLVVVPRVRGGQLEFAIQKPVDKGESWPVGWPPKKPMRDVVPDIVQGINVELDDVALTRVLDVVAERLKVPILLDHNGLARQGIDPTQVKARLPKSQSSYATILGRILFPAGLRWELRVDEAGKPLIWVTTVK